MHVLNMKNKMSRGLSSTKLNREMSQMRLPVFSCTNIIPYLVYIQSEIGTRLATILVCRHEMVNAGS